MKTLQDEHLGLLTWDAEFQEWHGDTNLPSAGNVGIELPAEYIDSIEVRKQVWSTLRIIERDELWLRQQAANELFTKGGYTLFLGAHEQFNLSTNF